jgi:hypothetical protein
VAAIFFVQRYRLFDLHSLMYEWDARYLMFINE